MSERISLELKTSLITFFIYGVVSISEKLIRCTGFTHKHELKKDSKSVEIGSRGIGGGQSTLSLSSYGVLAWLKGEYPVIS